MPGRKDTRKAFGKTKRASSLLELVYCNICGLINVMLQHDAYYLSHLQTITLDSDMFT